MVKNKPRKMPNEQPAKSDDRPGVGTQLTEFGRRFGGLDLKTARDPSPAEPAKFDADASL